ncbi:hypothetical protein HMPREF9441_00189 [Paraprevotella clara YIT 11840]|uniref:Uncharacterized protein n=1 Tax=Paraprevotella clara YIT 11840 TaxID=762968 RepID=G5SLH0_9BACT|nr:hypothetical protein HMPREF9441_00189 [Paraprevotella clara YIT 11840]
MWYKVTIILLLCNALGRKDSSPFHRTDARYVLSSGEGFEYRGLGSWKYALRNVKRLKK